MVFSSAAFSQSCLYAANFYSTIFLRKIVKTRKAADRDYSGALVNQNFPYSTKKLTRGFSSKLVKMRRGFHAQDFHFLGGAYLVKTVLKSQKIFARIRPS